MRLLVLVLAFAAVLGAGCALRPSTPSSPVPMDNTTTATGFPGVLPTEEIANAQARISTNMGDILVQFYPDTAPMAVSNFVRLAQQGFYDGVIFHRVIEGFMIQGGDPTGTGRGGPGYAFADEIDDDRTYARGTLAMANAGADTNGSQFFIMHKDFALPHDYTIFGYVTEGMDVVDAIAATPTDATDRPQTEIVMQKVSIEIIP